MALSCAFGPTDTARKTCAELSHDLVGSCRQGQSIRGSLHQWPRSFRCSLAGLQLGWSVLSRLTIFAAAWLIKKPLSEPSMISSMPWCFACWRVSLLKRFIVSNAHTTYGAFFLYVALFAADRCDLASARL